MIKIISNAKAKPSPIMMPYPNPWDKGAVKVTVPDDMVIKAGKVDQSADECGPGTADK